MAEHRTNILRRNSSKLVQEIGDGGTIKIDSIRSSSKEAENTAHSKRGFIPTTVDFIRRCQTKDQALEIIDFLERRNEIERNYAKMLKSQLVELGLSSFGKHRRIGCYERS